MAKTFEDLPEGIKPAVIKYFKYYSEYLKNNDLEYVIWSVPYENSGTDAFLQVLCGSLGSEFFKYIGDRIPPKVFFSNPTLFEGDTIILPSNIIKICNAAFGFSGVTDISMPWVKEIEADAFCGCIGLKKVKLGDTLTSLNERVFFGCEGLTEIEIPSGVKTISDECFSACSRLNNVILKEGLEEIGKYAFLRCISLEDINLPKTLRIIETSAFSGCNLTIHAYKEQADLLKNLEENINSLEETSVYVVYDLN